MKLMKFFIFLLTFVLIATLFLEIAKPVSAKDSPLTDPAYTWAGSKDYGLPWYSVEDWEIEVCTRGLSTSMGYDSRMNKIVGFSLSTPIYRDTITLLAKKIISDDITYYEVGWYVQPFEGTYSVNVTLSPNKYSLASGKASKEKAFDGYKAFPVPCDPKIYGTCLPEANYTRVKLSWKEGKNNTQYLISKFIKVNETNQ